MNRWQRTQRWLWVAILLGLSGSHLYAAQEYAGEFLTLGVGARALALGGSYVAVADDATAAYWNPAGLAGLSHTEASFMHSSLFGLDSYDFANYVHPKTAGGSLALSWIRLGINDIIRTELPNANQPVGVTNRPRIRDTFSVSNNAFLLSYARPIAELPHGAFSLGGSGKLIYMTGLGNTNAVGVGGDLGGLWHLGLGEEGRFSVGLAVRDFFRTKLHWNTPPAQGENSQTDTIHPSVVAALALQSELPGVGGDLLLSVDGDSRAGWEWHFGGEYVIADLLALRLGVQERQGLQTNWEFTAGAGLNLAFVTGSAFAVDYAFLSSELGPSHRISLGVRL